ncbi:MAG: branched-chain-amino-acid transaminase [Kiritimatiellaeota bacterium]|nr:branched-chain-amino-acid transaminase [Kiritimatiellota bacterium]
MKIYMNGKLVPESRAKVSVFDHGLLYGDGVFEGIRAYHGRVFKLDEHIARLFRSAQAIDLKMPLTKAGLAQAVVRTCQANGIWDGYIRLIVTRGLGNLGLNPYTCKTPQVIIIAGGIQLYAEKLYATGLDVITVGTLRNHTEAINPRIKSLNYLNNILAKIEAMNAGCMECIMLNPQGFVAEASGDNIFVVRGDTLLTPPSWCGALEGITRQTVMELAPEQGLQARAEVLTRYDLYTADEVFLTGTAAEIIAVVKADRRIIGSGRPGPVTRRLERVFREHARSSGTPIG